MKRVIRAFLGRRRDRQQQQSEPRYPEELEEPYFGEHIFTDAYYKGASFPPNGSYLVPYFRDFDDSPPPVGLYPDRGDFGQAADDQLQPALFKLPAEVREEIYAQLCIVAGAGRHLFVKDDMLTHTTCVTDHDGPDERQTCLRDLGFVERCRAGQSEDPAWSRRLVSSWCNHWRCEEAAMAEAGAGARFRTPFLPMLLTCKMIYLEFLPVMYRNLTFTFHRVETALCFFSRRLRSPVVSDMRQLQLSFNLSIPQGGGTGPRDLWYAWHGGYLVWRYLLDSLPDTAPNLRRLSVWLDATHPRNRYFLGRSGDPWFWVDRRLAPALRVSLPLAHDAAPVLYARDGIGPPGEYFRNIYLPRDVPPAVLPSTVDTICLRGEPPFWGTPLKYPLVLDSAHTVGVLPPDPPLRPSTRGLYIR